MSDNIFPEETLPPPAPKRERAKDTSPMAQAKCAATRIKIHTQSVQRCVDSITVLQNKVNDLSLKNADYILTLPPEVIAILKAGGVL